MRWPLGNAFETEELEKTSVTGTQCSPDEGRIEKIEVTSIKPVMVY